MVLDMFVPTEVAVTCMIVGPAFLLALSLGLTLALESNNTPQK